ncbi:MAG: preprotein translocase subunit SecE [Clostridiales bacterium]|nr:preprotein translocase subunit SecE [Clostridiales bacterium]
MADEKTNAKGDKKPNFFQKVVNFFKNLPGKIAKPFKNMWHELRKVTWPSRKDLITYSVVVIIFMVFMAVVIGLLDMGSTALVNLLGSIGK